MAATFGPSSRVEPPLDASWTRVQSFAEAGPSKWLQQRDKQQRQPDERQDRMQLDGANGDIENSLGASRAEPDTQPQDNGDGGDDEWEYSEEEELITLDLGPDTQRIVRISDDYSVTGLETTTPFLQLGSLVFKGRWDKLIGTEILLRQEDAQSQADDDDDDADADDNDNRGSRDNHDDHDHEAADGHQRPAAEPGVRSNGAGQTRIHRRQEQRMQLLPLPMTATDRIRGTAPSTTRHRIQFAQASNLAAKEAALSARARGKTGVAPGTSASADGIAEGLQRATISDAARRATGVVTNKNHVWVRGYGWVRKEKTPWLRDVIYGQVADGSAKAQDAAITTSTREEQVRPRGDGTTSNHSQAPPIQLQDETPSAEALAPDATNESTLPTSKSAEPAKRGRKVMNDEEKRMHSIWMALKKVDRFRSQAEVAADGGVLGQDADEDGGEAEGGDDDADGREEISTADTGYTTGIADDEDGGAQRKGKQRRSRRN